MMMMEMSAINPRELFFILEMEIVRDGSHRNTVCVKRYLEVARRTCRHVRFVMGDHEVLNGDTFGVQCGRCTTCRIIESTTGDARWGTEECRRTLFKFENLDVSGEIF